MYKDLFIIITGLIAASLLVISIAFAVSCTTTDGVIHYEQTGDRYVR
jgi:hypothetical protein